MHMFDPPTILPYEAVKDKLTNWMVAHEAMKTADRDTVASMLYYEFLNEARDQMLERITARYATLEKARLRDGMKIKLSPRQEDEFDFGV